MSEQEHNLQESMQVIIIEEISLRRHKHKVGPVTNCYKNGWQLSPFNNNNKIKPIFPGNTFQRPLVTKPQK